MPVDPVLVESSILFVKGSHQWGKWFNPRKFATNKNYVIEKSSQEKTFEDVPDIDNQPNKYDILKWDVQVDKTA